MSYRDIEPVSKQLTIVVGLTVVGFMAFGLALSFYRNILFEETLRTIGAENEQLAEHILQSQHTLEYYQSAQYKDKYAKENMGRLNAGEKILIIAEDPRAPDFTLTDAFTATEEQEVMYQEYLRQLPTIEHWRLYLFEKERIEELKKAL